MSPSRMPAAFQGSAVTAMPKPLAHLFPAADVPVLQPSLHAGAPLAYHLDLGARLAPLRERGVFIGGSGNVVHNLGMIEAPPRAPQDDTAQDLPGDVPPEQTNT